MNERIDELMIESGARFEFLHGVHYDDFQYKKFAQLIVKECVDKVDKAGFAFNAQPQYNDKQNALVSEGFFWALESVKQQITEHFGVEE
jgi:hypothetical protein